MIKKIYCLKNKRYQKVKEMNTNLGNPWSYFDLTLLNAFLKQSICSSMKWTKTNKQTKSTEVQVIEENSYVKRPIKRRRPGHVIKYIHLIIRYIF